MEFRNKFAERIFNQKYAMTTGETWKERVDHIMTDVVGNMMPKEERDELRQMMINFQFLPGGRYIYYAGRPAAFYNNCYLLKGEEDTREEWANIFHRASSCLMTGGGIGVDYSVFRPKGVPLARTGGTASGPLPLMEAVNEIGRRVMQGGSRRSAIYASLDWQHADAQEFLRVKDWANQWIHKNYSVADAKVDNFDYHAPLDMTNMSLNYNDHFLAAVSRGTLPPVFKENITRALQSGEPGFSFNFGPYANDTLRNACTEVTSSDDSDVCNLGSVNMAAIESKEHFEDVCYLGSKFLVCGTETAQLPYQKVYDVRQRNRRLGLGFMGAHEWLLKRGYRYEVTPEMHRWMQSYQMHSTKGGSEQAALRGLSTPVAYRAVAPTGTIGILAGTTTGIEPLFALAYKRRFLKGTSWHYQVVIDSVASQLIDEYGLDPDKIETSLGLAADPERRIKFQADVQDYVDMGISSTLNLPTWGSDLNNEDRTGEFADLVARYAHRLRGLTVYPDGARGGQPLTAIDYHEALKMGDEVHEETSDVCDLTGKGGSCGA